MRSVIGYVRPNSSRRSSQRSEPSRPLSRRWSSEELVKSLFRELMTTIYIPPFRFPYFMDYGINAEPVAVSAREPGPSGWRDFKAQLSTKRTVGIHASRMAPQSKPYLPPLPPAPKIISSVESISALTSPRRQQQRNDGLARAFEYNFGDQPGYRPPPAPRQSRPQISARSRRRRADIAESDIVSPDVAYRLLADARRDEAEARREAIKRDHDFAAQLMRRGPEIAALPLPPEMCLPQQSGSPDRPFVQVQRLRIKTPKNSRGASPTRLER